MDKNTKDTSSHNNDTKSSEKNAQDVNKQPAHSSMPNPNKNHQVGEEEEKENKDTEIKASNTGVKNDTHSINKPSDNAHVKTDPNNPNAAHAKNQDTAMNNEKSTAKDNSAYKNHENENKELNSGAKSDTHQTEK